MIVPGRLLLALPVLLAGCAAPAPPAAPPDPAPELAAAAPPTAPESRREPATEDPLLAFEQRHRMAAELAAQQGRWADAIWACEVVLALRPGDAAAQALRGRAQAAVAAGVGERRPRAQQARQRGELDAATRLYLEILALSPDDGAAADALREIERQRTRRGNVIGHRLPDNGGVRRPAQQAAAMAGRGQAPVQGERRDLNDLEHASMLAAQGEIDAAITLLQPLATGPRADPAARASLAEMHWRQAVRLEGRGDAAGAIAALQRCLQFAPGHRQARDRLSALTSAPR